MGKFVLKRIGQALVVGENRPFIAALLTLDEEALPAWANEHGVADLDPVDERAAARRAPVEEPAPRPRRYHAAEAGARSVHWTVLRLPWEVAPLFRDWLDRHHPGKAAHVMGRIQAIRGGKDNDARFGSRMRGEGVEAELMHQRFRVARKRLGYGALPPLRTDLFVPPRKPSPQGELF